MEFTGTLATPKTPLPLVALHQCPAIGRSSRIRAGTRYPIYWTPPFAGINSSLQALPCDQYECLDLFCLQKLHSQFRANLPQLMA